MSKFTIDTGARNVRRRSSLHRSRRALTPFTHSDHSVPLPFEVLVNDKGVTERYAPKVITSIADHHFASTLPN
ncbi:hypothetical protein L4D00_22460 [Photobacterium swingsii]|uniref:hypothetical protein n=1 Tax=Photobacterium swingsii TaxID=680026 RepID=UPI000AC49547|nr:hypothetical protein [Photobacterium swingsii]